MERVIAIFGMIFGVIGFSFIIGSITNVISETHIKNATFTKYMKSLRKLKIKKVISYKLHQKVLKSLLRRDYINKISNTNEMLGKFPKYLKKELKYQMNKHKLKHFHFIHKFSKSIINSIGPFFKKTQFYKGNYNKETLYIGKMILRIKCIFWIKA